MVMGKTTRSNSFADCGVSIQLNANNKINRGQSEHEASAASAGKRATIAPGVDLSRENMQQVLNSKTQENKRQKTYNTVPNSRKYVAGAKCGNTCNR